MVMLTCSQVVKKGDLPKRPPVVRKSPITARDWSSLLDNEGRIVNAKLAKQMIFRGVGWVFGDYAFVFVAL